MTVLDAVYTLDQLASARTPNSARLVSGAIALIALQVGNDDENLLQAATELRFMAAVGPLNLSAGGRARFKALADSLQRMTNEVPSF